MYVLKVKDALVVLSSHPNNIDKRVLYRLTFSVAVLERL